MYLLHVPLSNCLLLGKVGCVRTLQSYIIYFPMEDFWLGINKKTKGLLCHQWHKQSQI